MNHSDAFTLVHSFCHTFIAAQSLAALTKVDNNKVPTNRIFREFETGSCFTSFLNSCRSESELKNCTCYMKTYWVWTHCQCELSKISNEEWNILFEVKLCEHFVYWMICILIQSREKIVKPNIVSKMKINTNMLVRMFFFIFFRPITLQPKNNIYQLTERKHRKCFIFNQ